MTPKIGDDAENIKVQKLGFNDTVLNYWLKRNGHLYIHAIEYIHRIGYIVYYDGEEKDNI